MRLTMASISPTVSGAFRTPDQSFVDACTASPADKVDDKEKNVPKALYQIAKDLVTSPQEI